MSKAILSSHVVTFSGRRSSIWLTILILLATAATPGRLFGDPRKGLTWGLVSHNGELDIDRVGCYGRPRVDGTEDGPPCNPYKGDTPCSEALPILCLKKENLPRPNYAVVGKGHAMPAEYYNGWTGGRIALTRPVRGDALTSLETADTICERQLGPGYRMPNTMTASTLWGWDETPISEKPGRRKNCCIRADGIGMRMATLPATRGSGFISTTRNSATAGGTRLLTMTRPP